MNYKSKNYLLLFLTGILLRAGYAQTSSPGNFYREISNYDLSELIAPDSITIRDGSVIKHQAALGFIGDEYERMQIHFTSVVKNPENPHQYKVKGKTRVSGVVSPFTGTFTVIEATADQVDSTPFFGLILFEVELMEERSHEHTGIFKGTMGSRFVCNDPQALEYDALEYDNRVFSNNQFTGTWSNYNGTLNFNCAWGDYRIPNSGDLDVGENVFAVNYKYVKNGWKIYMQALKGDSKATSKETEEWWR